MSALLKDIYSKPFYNKFADAVTTAYPGFQKQKFIQFIFHGNWPEMELKERMRHTSLGLYQFLPQKFDIAVKTISSIITTLQNNGAEMGFQYMFFPDYIEVYGLDHFHTSVDAMEFITRFTSCEFAVRPFLIKYGFKMMQQMLDWSLHENPHVRRLASEGMRPRLPWAMAVPALKKDPSPILPILENLKNDPSEFVRRSVANNLNDISKSHPSIVMEIAHQWKGASKETDAIIKHASRTLLKQAHPEIMKYYGFTESTGIALSGFKINTPRVKIGNNLEFSFTVKNREAKAQIVRLEYAVLYRKKNGQLSKKVFKISERSYRGQEKAVVLRKQSFKNITTRKFYPGRHKLSVIINGKELKTAGFELTN